ncbi:MAG: hypothetical protein ACYC1Z_14970 [Georgenia sp.]
MMTSTSVRGALLTLPDVAGLARVQRPVVSVWRSRSSGSDHPFPPAVVRTGNQELFDAGAVTNWLVTTGRGNNPHVAQESALFATFHGADGTGDQLARDGVTALLTLKALTEERLTGLRADELLDLGDDVDQHDEMLYRELVALGEDLPALAAHVDAMTDAAFTPAAAFESVMAHRFRHGLPGYTATSLSPAAVDLVARLAAELGDGSSLTFVDPSGGSDLLVAVRHHLPEDADPVAAVNGGAGRLERRRLVTHGWHVTAAEADVDERLALRAGSLVIAQYPSPTAPEVTDAEVLTAVDDVALAMGEHDRAVILAPASALVDGTRSREIEQARSALLRTDRVRAMVRLPAGLWTARPRQRLALWVLGRAHPDVAIADRWVAVADLTTELDAGAVEDLVTDVVAALGTRAEVHGHAFRFARLARTSALLAAGGNLVDVPPPSVRRPRPMAGELAVRTTVLLGETGLTVPTAAFQVEAHEPGRGRLVTVGELISARAARIVPGNRIDDADIASTGSIRVIGSEELLGEHAIGQRNLDRLTFTSRYPAGRFTEPGDIIFSTAAGVAAMVDDEGFAVVPTPARVLRLNRAVEPRLVPAVVARAMSAATGTNWRTWPVPLVPADQAERLGVTLATVAGARADTQRRLAALEELADVLIEGTATGALTLHPTPETPHPETEG